MKKKNLKQTIIKQTVNTSEKRFSVLEKDITVLKKDVAVLKKDVAVLKEDVKEIKKDYVTKDYLDTVLAQMHDAFIQDMRLLISQREDRILTVLDGLVKNIEDLRAENAAHTSSYQRLEKTSDNHEVRISTLEKVTR